MSNRSVPRARACASQRLWRQHFSVPQARAWSQRVTTRRHIPDARSLRPCGRRRSSMLIGLTCRLRRSFLSGSVPRHNQRTWCGLFAQSTHNQRVALCGSPSAVWALPMRTTALSTFRLFQTCSTARFAGFRRFGLLVFTHQTRRLLFDFRKAAHSDVHLIVMARDQSLMIDVQNSQLGGF
jgi:hypothetical protein